MLIAIVALNIMEIHQMNVKIAFLNGELNEYIWTNQKDLWLKVKNTKFVIL